MNWGRGIIIAMSAFVGFIIYMVVVIMSKKADLQTEDYYLKEIAFDQQIAAVKQYNALGEKLSIQQDTQYIIVQFPNALTFENASLYLMRPNDKKDDFNMELKNSKTFLIEKQKLKKGTYELEIKFDSEGKLCLYKEQIAI